ncbi:unnamed protein product, partial [Ilex paraguariensis]
MDLEVVDATLSSSTMTRRRRSSTPATLWSSGTRSKSTATTSDTSSPPLCRPGGAGTPTAFSSESSLETELDHERYLDLPQPSDEQ